ncbi:MAG: isoprenylcysteine carboxylmethyltransferase family protein [Chloroflexi bacterium]|nr:isoprenylcysteine carboxylmethyltransferase family protein [Chloroflexota bacterium]
MDALEGWLRLLGGMAVLLTLSTIFAGLWRGWRHPLGRALGAVPRMLRTPVFYLVAGVLYFGLCAVMWLPLPIELSPAIRIVSLVVGALLFFSGLALVLWGRLTLGRLYNVSYSFGVQLYADHRLITHGPFAIVRHPMYLGILLTGLGGILLYRTWTLVFLAANFLGLLIRARREEQALAAEFGKAWQDYCRRVPGFVPRIGLKRR